MIHNRVLECRRNIFTRRIKRLFQGGLCMCMIFICNLRELIFNNCAFWPYIPVCGNLKSLWIRVVRSCLLGLFVSNKGFKDCKTKVEGSLSTLKVRRIETKEGFLGSVHKKLLIHIYASCEVVRRKVASNSEKSNSFLFGGFNMWVSIQMDQTLH